MDFTDDISLDRYNFIRRSVGWREVDKRLAVIGLQNSKKFVAEIDGQAVGMVRIVTDGGYIAVIVDMIVLPEYQGQGIGKVLMQRVMDYLNNKVQDGERIYVSLTAAEGKENFYKPFGFMELPTEGFGAGMSQYIDKF